jgi:hypothetical protein
MLANDPCRAMKNFIEMKYIYAILIASIILMLFFVGDFLLFRKQITNFESIMDHDDDIQEFVVTNGNTGNSLRYHSTRDIKSLCDTIISRRISYPDHPHYVDTYHAFIILKNNAEVASFDIQFMDDNKNVVYLTETYQGSWSTNFGNLYKCQNLLPKLPR